MILLYTNYQTTDYVIVVPRALFKNSLTIQYQADGS